MSVDATTLKIGLIVKNMNKNVPGTIIHNDPKFKIMYK